MSRKASQFQKKAMSRIYRGKEIFKHLNTGRIDEHVSCIREWIANIFFYTKDGTTIMIDAGYNYDRLAEKMSWQDIDPSDTSGMSGKSFFINFSTSLHLATHCSSVRRIPSLALRTKASR